MKTPKPKTLEAPNTPPSIAPATPPRPHALKRQADRSLFSNGDSGILLYFENPKLLAYVRSAAESIVQHANHLERVFTEFAVRQLWRAIRNGTIEAAAIDVEMAERELAVAGRWGEVDPVSAYHLSTRDAATRASIREYSKLEQASIRAFKETAAMLKSFR